MSKFKVGDKVRFVNCTTPIERLGRHEKAWLENGTILTIHEVRLLGHSTWPIKIYDPSVGVQSMSNFKEEELVFWNEKYKKPKQPRQIKSWRLTCPK